MADRKKIMVVPFGVWLGHSAGKQSYGPDEGQRIVDRANALIQSSGNPIVIDYDHVTLDPKADGALAAGWMYALTLENDGVYAEVEWTPKATERIKSGEYKYISPVICSGGPDPVTGEVVDIELFNAALTNIPFMHDRMQQVVASATQGKDWYTNSKQLIIHNTGASMDIAQKFSELKAALGLAETAGPEEVIGLVKKIAELMAAMPGAPGEGVPTPEQMGGMETEMKQQMMNSRVLSDVANLLSVTPDKVLPTVAAMTNKTTDTDGLKTRLATLEAELLERNAADLIAANSKKIAPAKREFWLNYAKANGIQATKTVLDEMPDVLPTEDPAASTEKEKSTDAEVLRFSKEIGLSDEDIKKYSRNKEVK